MEWLFPSVVATLAGTFILSAVYFYLYKWDRDSTLFIWGIGWLVYGIRFLFMLVIISDVLPAYRSVLTAANQLCTLYSGYILIYGTYRFVGKKIPGPWAIITIVVSGWIITALCLKLPFLIETLPEFLFVGSIYFWTGVVFLRSSHGYSGGRNLTGWAFIVWGIHKMDYPFLRPVAWFAPWGYLLGASLEITVALGILIIYFNQSRWKLRESEQRFRSLVERAPLPLAYVDVDGTISMINNRFTAVLGYNGDDVPTLEDWWSLAYPDDQYREQVKSLWSGYAADAAANNNVIAPDEYKVSCKDGTVKDIIISGTEIEGAWLVSLNDVTEMRRSEEERRELEIKFNQIQKMEAIGTLAGGIAHDFNNILGGIMGYADIALGKIKKDDFIEKYLQKIMSASERAKQLVQQILAFSRQSNGTAVPIQIKLIVTEVAELLRATLPSSIELQISCSGDIKPILAEATKFHEIVMNLCTNAAHAMKNKGVLRIECDEVNTTEPFKGRMGTSPPGPYARLSVRDTGTGMDKQTIDRIFEPFFTTKEIGTGTGMGLSVVYGIIQKMEGNILIESVPGEGSCFTIFLPQTDSRLNTTENKDALEIPCGSETILFVDDEELLCEMTTALLEQCGYTVHPFTDTEEAMEFYSLHHEGIDLIITDLTMPKHSGIELSRKCTALRKDIPILLCTGNCSDAEEKAAKASGIKAVLIKPVRKYELACMVRKLLDQHVAPM